MRSNHIRGASILVASSTLLSAVVLAGTAGTGDDAMQYRGSHVADAGDLDGDGVSDVVVAIPGTPQSGLLKEGPMYQGWAEVLSGKDFKRLRVITGEKDDIEFGLALAAGRDIDGDGVPDLVLGSPGAATSAGNVAGAAYVHSGKKGARLRTFEGRGMKQKQGIATAFLGDQDGDGVPEIAVGSTRGDGVASPWIGKVVVLSGKSGSEIRVLRGETQKDDFGAAIADAGDLDGDSVTDVAVGAPGTRSDEDVIGKVVLFSGGTGKRIRQLDGESAGDRFGASVAAIGDVDRDKVPDIAVGVPAGAKDKGGFVALFSGKTGARIAKSRPLDGGGQVGRSVAACGDLSGDGVPDVLVGAPGRKYVPGTVLLLSGKDLSVAWKASPDAEASDLGSSVCSWRDFNEDGIPDVLAGSPRSGKVLLLSGKDGALLREVGISRREPPKQK